jgi:hypothetical protein
MIGVAVTGQFFDRQKVKNMMDKKTWRSLMELARRVRKRAQKSLIYSTAVSTPGMPPFVHRTTSRTRTSKSTGRVRTQFVSPLREHVAYAYDSQTKSAVVGPAKLNKPANLGALEHGGQSLIVDRLGVQKQITIAPRPFMKPAAEAELPGAAKLWEK